ncbi:MAG: glycosyltransferase [Candidatus Omnitrophica bacterium]|nr:glycosyltransferase [Candidatus Omnitrophota bacterium]
MDISVIVPVLNEDSNIKALYKQLNDTFAGCKSSYEVLFVDDGSTDNSLRALADIALHDSNIKVISFDRTYGQASAVDAGFKNSSGDILLTIDADLQYDPADLMRIVNEIKSGNFDIVLGHRVNRAAGFIKALSSKIAISVRNFVLKESYLSCSMAGYKRGCLKNLMLYDNLQPLIPALLTAQGYRYKEILIQESPRRHGKSKYNLRNRFLKSIWALLAVKWMKDNKLRYKILKTLN